MPISSIPAYQAEQLLADRLTQTRELQQPTAIELPNVSDPSSLHFDEQLMNAINSVSESQLNADNNIQAMLRGEDVGIHETVLALEEAELKLRTMVTVKNKVIEAYKDIMRMSV